MEYHDDPQAFNAWVIQSLLEDGSDPNAIYEIEHHFSSDDFDMLEKAAVALFKLNYEVSDAEEFETDDGLEILAFDALGEVELDVDKLNAQTEQMEKIAKQYHIQYDGWGTEYIPMTE